METPKIVVLVVEDEFLVRMAIVDHLQDEGFIVREASNADEAVEILVNDLSVSIMFTDIDMPGGMDGLKLAAAVRKRWPPINIVITSGHRVVNVDQLPVEAAFFPKPYNPDVIVNTFRTMTQQ